MRGAHPPLRDPLEFEFGGQRDGWQHEAAIRVDFHFRDMSLFCRISEGTRALIRSQAGPMAGLAFSVTPSTRLTRLELHVMLLRRLGVAIHSTQVATTAQFALGLGVLGRRGFALESAAARVCREVGGRVRPNLLMREMDGERCST